MPKGARGKNQYPVTPEEIRDFVRRMTKQVEAPRDALSSSTWSAYVKSQFGEGNGMADFISQTPAYIAELARDAGYNVTGRALPNGGTQYVFQGEGGRFVSYADVLESVLTELA